MSIEFTSSLDQNIAALQRQFAGDNTFVTREVRSPSGLRCAIFFFDGMVNATAINESVVRPLLREHRARLTAEELAQSAVQVNDSRVEPDVGRMLASFLYGDTVILTEGDARPVVVNTKGFSTRSTSEPEGEKVLRGPREGFTELFMSNLSMLRRRLNDPRLKFTFSRIGERTNTVVCLCYLEGVADAKLVKTVQRRLAKLHPDSVLDSNYIAERIRDDRHSPFPTLGSTERPDVAAARMLEGRVAVVVDGSPVVLTAPCILQECFQANDDYYISTFQAGIARLLRYAAFLLTLTVPALYLACVLHHQELIPTRLLLAITAAQRGVPLPPVSETFLLLVVFELLKEAGTRTPGVIGQTMSIVGGLVLGQAAVQARFISAPAVIIVAVAGVTGLALPKLQSSTTVLRFALAAFAAVLGLYGLVFGLSLVLLHLCGLDSCETPYLLNLLPRVHPHTEDSFLRAPWFKMRRNRFLTQKEDK